MSQVPDYFMPHDGDGWELQQLRSIGEGYWRNLVEVAKGIDGARIEDINAINLSKVQTFGRRCSIVTRPPYRLHDGAEGFAYVRYLVEHYQDQQSAEWREVRAHLDRLQADQRHLEEAPLAQQARDHNKAQKERASKPRNKVIVPLIGRVAKTHPGLSAKELWSHLINALQEGGYDPKSMQVQPGKKERMEYWIVDKKKTISLGTLGNILKEFTPHKK